MKLWYKVKTLSGQCICIAKSLANVDSYRSTSMTFTARFILAFTYPLVLIRSDCSEPCLWEDEGLEVLAVPGSWRLVFTRNIDHVKPWLILVHRVQYDL